MVVWRGYDLQQELTDDLADVTLADEDRTQYQLMMSMGNPRQCGNAMHHLVANIETNASGNIWWPN